MICCIFYLDVTKMPCSCIRTQTVVRQENTPQVKSLQLIDLGLIFDGCTPNTRIYISNSRIIIRVVMT